MMIMPGHVVSLVVLVLVLIVAVGAFAMLWVLAWSRWRSPVAGFRRVGNAYDWRTLPPKDERDAMAVEDAEEYGPLWRYGVPLGYGRVYDAGHDRGYGPS